MSNDSGELSYSVNMTLILNLRLAGIEVNGTACCSF